MGTEFNHITSDTFQTARPGDRIRFTGGTLSGQSVVVTSADGNVIAYRQLTRWEKIWDLVKGWVKRMRGRA